MGEETTGAAGERRALISLSVAGQPPAERQLLDVHLASAYGGFTPMSVGDACDALAEARTAAPHPVPRLVVLDALVRLGSRQPSALTDPAAGPGVDHLIATLLPGDTAPKPAKVKRGASPGADPVATVRAALAGIGADMYPT